MFIACMVCHGELYAQKPHPRRLTGYYLMISLGGALGGFMVAVVAPHVFTTYAELAWSCAVCAVLVWLVCLPNWRVPDFQWWRFHAWMASSLVAMAVCLAFFIQSHEKDNLIESTRNFYGAMSVLEYGSETPGSRYLLLQHGRITHGFQLTDPDQRRRITSYYGEGSGVALAIHISNRYLDLEPVVENLAKEFGYLHLSVSDGDGDKDWWIYSSTWVLLTKNKELMSTINGLAKPNTDEKTKKVVPLWTDDYASLLPIMSW